MNRYKIIGPSSLRSLIQNIFSIFDLIFIHNFKQKKIGGMVNRLHLIIGNYNYILQLFHRSLPLQLFAPLHLKYNYQVLFGIV